MIKINLFIIIILICSCEENYKTQKANDQLYSIGLTKSEANKKSKETFSIFKNTNILKREIEMERSSILLNDLEMKFDVKFFGEKPKDGWDLYFSLHGGGGVADSYNENQWLRYMNLYTLEQGILLTPRSPTNTWNMWHQKHIDAFFNRLIQNMFILYNVNPNRVYLMGYSAGGDGVFQLAPRMSDRFAAASMMAGHPNETLPIGLRNIGFTIHMGENDSLYKRNLVAIDWERRLNELKRNDPGGYSYQVKIYKGKGHHISHAKRKGLPKPRVDGLDSSGITWMSTHNRNPFPKKIVWKQDDVTHNRFYWLWVDNPEQYSLIIASIQDQNIIIQKSTVDNLKIRLNDTMLDMDKKVRVTYHGKTIFNDLVPRLPSVITRTIKENGDPMSIFYGEIIISLEGED